MDPKEDIDTGTPQESSKAPVPAREMIVSNMAVQGGRNHTKTNQPIHETMTIAALITSEVPIDETSTYHNCTAEVKEFLRGVLWNDDPACLLFDDDKNSNENYILSTGFEWGTAFKSAEFSGEESLLGKLVSFVNPRAGLSLTGRSHFGDLQFFHAMATQDGEPPTDTRNKVLMWLELMYRLASGDRTVSQDTQIQDVQLPHAALQPGALFSNTSDPPGTATLRWLLARNGQYVNIDIRRRALGSCFHIIQDSYSYGHVRRQLLNENDRVSIDPLRFRDGVADRWGPVLNFHTYRGQPDTHKHYDHADAPMEYLTDLKNLDQFNRYVGVRDGIDKCAELATLWHNGHQWDDGVGRWCSEVFTVSEYATPANHDV